jgi:hypothetical protein
MTPRQVADVGVARLALPVPMAKLVTIQAIASALSDEATSEIYAEALIEWISTRELESQCLEALCPLLITESRPALFERVRTAIPHPSPASELLISIAANGPAEVSAWAGSHSGPVPKHLNLAKEEKALHAGSFIPLIFREKLAELQEQSGYSFLRQWAFEYKTLSDQTGSRSDGHLDYFFESERSNTGQFVAVRGHLARSAYLRTLTYATEDWKMPNGHAFRYASAALPADPIFLRVAPQSVPAWAPFIHERSSIEASDPRTLARTVVEHIEQAEQAKIVHCSLAVVNEPRCHVELEVFAVVHTGHAVDARKAFGFYRHLLGKDTPFRHGLRAFVSRPIDSETAQMLGFGPLAVPLIGSNVGYLQADLLSRPPYMPVSTTRVRKVALMPQEDRAPLLSEGREIGGWNWWRWNWNPGHPVEWPTPTACCTYVKEADATQMANDLNGRLEYVWMLTTWQRDSDYGDWTSTEQIGNLEG